MFPPFSLVPPRSQSLSGFPSFHLSLPPPSNSLVFLSLPVPKWKKEREGICWLGRHWFPPLFLFFQGGKGEEEDGWLCLSVPNFFNKKKNYSFFWETKECICLLILNVPVKTRFETSFLLSSVGKILSAPQKKQRQWNFRSKAKPDFCFSLPLFLAPIQVCILHYRGKGESRTVFCPFRVSICRGSGNGGGKDVGGGGGRGGR